ncbi:MAG: helix-turn-helix domain-containing protein [Candidatus Thiodiazotropha sp. (ex Ctena orbiculata)]|uniref:Helix-turn-helix domain-containing protein n=1 Tax=Candidatus Thiodiazotropha taylori TaxID=2792791 RepID=A0A944QTR3_9GAMM|nr:helix-turn-helix domain-containing protein [Candidatus Thiodiazotropha taylori]MBV2138799.1 helix-turn-helix domain-containing protein [Candidatus Thiodiazotropha taylori]
MANSAKIPRLPTQEEAKLAAESSRLIAACVGEGETAELRLIDGEIDIKIPISAIHMLRDILNQMAQGNAVSLVPVHAELTTQQAADILNVSRPYLVKLLESGKIAFHKVGRHRRILFQDIMDYMAQRDSESLDLVNELSKEAQDLNMGY